MQGVYLRSNENGGSAEMITDRYSTRDSSGIRQRRNTRSKNNVAKAKIHEMQEAPAKILGSQTAAAKILDMQGPAAEILSLPPATAKIIHNQEQRYPECL